MTIWLVLGGLIIAVLAGVAIYLHWKLHQLNKKQAELKAAQDAKAKEKLDYINNSIQILAKGMIDDQLTLTEGSIRISMLLSYLSEAEAHKKEFIAFYQVADKTAHIPILEEWKKLPAKQRLQFDKERQVVEAEYEDFVVDAAKRIIGRQFPA